MAVSHIPVFVSRRGYLRLLAAASLMNQYSLAATRGAPRHYLRHYVVGLFGEVIAQTALGLTPRITVHKQGTPPWDLVTRDGVEVDIKAAFGFGVRPLLVHRAKCRAGILFGATYSDACDISERWAEPGWKKAPRWFGRLAGFSESQDLRPATPEECPRAGTAAENMVLEEPFRYPATALVGDVEHPSPRHEVTVFEFEPGECGLA